MAASAANAAEAANAGKRPRIHRARRVSPIISASECALGAAARQRMRAYPALPHPPGAAMPAYLIVNYEVEDPALYGEYAKAAGPAMKIGKECQLLALDPASDRIEGDSPGRQTGILP